MCVYVCTHKYTSKNMKSKPSNFKQYPLNNQFLINKWSSKVDRPKLMYIQDTSVTEIVEDINNFIKAI
jgi:hypothetical protein